MALTTKAEIKERIIDAKPQLDENPYCEDVLKELANDEVPIMNHDIIEEWKQMPHEFDDGWKEFGMDEYFYEGGIVRLMTIDLALYYEQMFLEVWNEMQVVNAN